MFLFGHSLLSHKYNRETSHSSHSRSDSMIAYIGQQACHTNLFFDSYYLVLVLWFEIHRILDICSLNAFMNSFFALTPNALVQDA
jgi:hypothetical protein